MRRLIPFLVLLVGSVALASPKAYRVTIAYSKNEKVVFKSKVVAKPGVPALISEKTESGPFFIEVTASEKDEKNPAAGILVKMKVGTIEDGKQKVTANFGVVALEGQKAEVKQQSDGPEKETEAAVVTVTRKK